MNMNMHIPHYRRMKSALTSMPTLFVLCSILWSATVAGAALSNHRPKLQEMATNEDVGVWDDELEVKVLFQPFQLQVEPTPIILEVVNASQIVQDLENMMNEYFSSMPPEVVGNFQYLQFESIERISFDSGSDDQVRRRLGGNRKLNSYDTDKRAHRKEESNNLPSSTLQIGGIQAYFINDPPRMEDMRDWLQILVNEYDFGSRHSMQTSTISVPTATARDNKGSPASPFYKISRIDLSWSSSDDKNYKTSSEVNGDNTTIVKGETNSHDNNEPSMHPTTKASPDEINAQSNAADQNKPNTSEEGNILIFIAGGGSLFCLCCISLLERNRRRNVSREIFIKPISISSANSNSNALDLCPTPKDIEVRPFPLGSSILFGTSDQPPLGSQPSVHRQHLLDSGETLDRLVDVWGSGEEAGVHNYDPTVLRSIHEEPVGGLSHHFLRTFSTITESDSSDEDLSATATLSKSSFILY